MTPPGDTFILKETAHTQPGSGGLGGAGCQGVELNGVFGAFFLGKGRLGGASKKELTKNANLEDDITSFSFLQA